MPRLADLAALRVACTYEQERIKEGLRLFCYERLRSAGDRWMAQCQAGPNRIRAQATMASLTSRLDAGSLSEMQVLEEIQNAMPPTCSRFDDDMTAFLTASEQADELGCCKVWSGAMAILPVVDTVWHVCYFPSICGGVASLRTLFRMDDGLAHACKFARDAQPACVSVFNAPIGRPSQPDTLAARRSKDSPPE